VSAGASSASPAFASPEGLRALLLRLEGAGPGAWREDREASELMAFAMQRYGALARKHLLEPADAAAAAFEAMRTRAVREADDPWAVVTRAVQITLIAEERANGLLCSTTRARRPEVSAHHDALRFSDRETPVWEYHPAFQLAAEQDALDLDDTGPSIETEPTSAFEAAESAVTLLTALGWPSDATRTGMDYICSRLISLGSRASAHESLRRDAHARVLLDLDRTSWAALLRIVLGSPHPDHAHTTTGRGLLMRLLIGYRPLDLLADDDLVLAIASAAPRPIRGAA